MTWMSRRATLFVLSGLFLSGLVVAGIGRPAGAALTGGCTASGTQLQTGKSYDAVKVDFAKIPRTGDVKWKGSVPVPPTKRLAVGEVQVKFPWPVGDVEIGHWGKDGKKTGSNANAGTYHYDFPQLIAGVKVVGARTRPGTERHPVHGLGRRRDRGDEPDRLGLARTHGRDGAEPVARHSRPKGRTMKYRGRPVLAAIFGFLTGLVPRARSRVLRRDPARQHRDHAPSDHRIDRRDRARILGAARPHTRRYPTQRLNLTIEDQHVQPARRSRPLRHACDDARRVWRPRALRVRLTLRRAGALRRAQSSPASARQEAAPDALVAAKVAAAADLTVAFAAQLRACRTAAGCRRRDQVSRARQRCRRTTRC